MEIQEGGKGVFAEKIGVVHIHHACADANKIALNPFATVPPLPPSFVNRRVLSKPIVHRLLSGSSTTALTAIEGMGGVGKTILALGVCHDKRIRARFSDGIVWLEIGREANVSKQDRIKRVADALNQKFAYYSEDAYRTVLSGKSVLVVLDDVWTRDVIEPFLVDSGRSRLLYTSRDNELAGPLGADNHHIGILDKHQARESFCLLGPAGRKEPPPEPYVSGILAECKGLALALAMIGGALKGKPDQRWKYLIADLKEAKLRDVGVRPGKYKYESLHASISVSIDELEPTLPARLPGALGAEQHPRTGEEIKGPWTS